MIRIVPLLLCLLLIAASAHAYESGDFQIWNTNDEDVKIGKDTKFTMEQEFRYGNDVSEFFYQHYQWGFIWAFDKRLELELGYRQIYEKITRRWMAEDEPYTVLTWKQDIWKFRFEDRNRIEYRHFSWYQDQLRYRNRFTLKYPIDFKKIVIAPYTSDEIFVSSNGTGFNQNRLQSGVEVGLTKYAKADISYMWQSFKIKGDKWGWTNVLWLRGKITF